MATSHGERNATAVLGGGCFWCTEAVLSELRGVSEVIPGYAGGARPDPTYEEVCEGTTGHAEVVRVTFDPSVLPFPDLLKVFFTTHDPTTRDRQGADVGTQYRSVVLYSDEAQHRAALQVVRELTEARLWPAPIVTELAPLRAFYPAEEYHRDYFRRNPGQGYCRAVIAPKVAKFRHQFSDRLRGTSRAEGTSLGSSL